MALEGFAERPAEGTVQGWVWDTAAPDQAVVVEAFDGGTFYQQATAATFRADLQAAGRRAGYCLFEMTGVPEGAEIQVLVDGTGHRLRSPPEDGVDVVEDWLDGPGAAMRPNLLVQRLCHDLIGRAATSLELLRFAGRTATATGLARLVRDILDEAPGTGLVTHRDVIREAYLGVLGRPADPSGLNSFAHALLTGTPISQVIRDLITSPEFTSLHVSSVKPDGMAELRALARTLQAAVTTLTMHATAPGPRPTADR